jgi:glycerophosphoryl diester phosphodiesterase
MPDHPFFKGLRPPLHISHRGGAGLAPENTVAAFRDAVSRYRTDMLEIDLQPTRDGEIVVFHDDTLERCTDGEGPISDQTFAELSSLDAGFRFTTDEGSTFPFRGKGERIPRFEDVLEAFPDVRLNIEIKADAPGLEAEVAERIRKAGATPRVCCGSSNDAVAERFFEALPEACHYYPTNALTQVVMALLQGEQAPRDDRFRVLAMPVYFGEMRLVTPALVAGAENLDRWVFVWTVDDADEMKRLLREGVHGIMTDRPDRLRAAIDAR